MELPLAEGARKEAAIVLAAFEIEDKGAFQGSLTEDQGSPSSMPVLLIMPRCRLFVQARVNLKPESASLTKRAAYRNPCHLLARSNLKTSGFVRAAFCDSSIYANTHLAATEDAKRLIPLTFARND
ncbi:hypothetical protein [Pseudorhodoplanes sp.]|uniref:hypothetical protein n=1 Tax=Pseudorhodoplanes sp. TaxID=1934341 RepID=UPI002D7E73D7|nr:hypothetical protein [Pseudorhodoplanes sp.]